MSSDDKIDKLKKRIYSVDLLRGIVMMIMLLDHTRDYVHYAAIQFDPTDPTQTTAAIFFTRWITHFCAPAFVFLSGVSIYLQRMAGKTNGQLARFLLTRGLWLVVLEFTVVRFGVTFDLNYGAFVGMAQVIWVIGISMIVMAVCIYLPLKIVGVLGVAMIVFHNLFDGFLVPPNIAFAGSPPPDLGQSLWIILHQQGIVWPGVFVAYPLIPWVGVMMAGFALGTVYEWSWERRRRWLLGLGFVAIALFVVMRASNFYGDPNPFRTESGFIARVAELRSDGIPENDPPGEGVPDPKMSEPEFSIVSFFNTQKYPPSLLFLLMTLGPAMIVLALADRIDGKAVWQHICIVFGRVPMFFYILQWFMAHGAGILLALLAGKAVMVSPPFPGFEIPPDHGFSLPVVYAAWIAGLIILYPLCRWWGNLKQRNKHWVLSYL